MWTDDLAYEPRDLGMMRLQEELGAILEDGDEEFDSRVTKVFIGRPQVYRSSGNKVLQKTKTGSVAGPVVVCIAYPGLISEFSGAMSTSTK